MANGTKEPKGDRNRIVIEGLDEPKRRTVDVDRLFARPRQRGRYSDRMRISPFKQGYYERKGISPGGTRSRRSKTRA